MSVQESNRSAVSGENSTAKAGKYLTFRLGTGEYGLAILKVREIIGLMKITEVPGVPKYVSGIINLRGMVIPVIDLRARLEVGTLENTDQTCIIVVEVQTARHSVFTGMIVDAVSEVIDIKAEELENVPCLGVEAKTECFLGMAKINNVIKILLDIDRVLETVDLAELAGTEAADRWEKAAV